MKRLLALFFFLSLTALAAAQGRTLPDFAELVEKQGAAVVNISTTQVIRGRAMAPLGIDEDDPRYEIFRRFGPRMPGGGIPREFENRSLGSGFIISSDGYILTNAHVVDSADEITVRLTDKREFKARAIGADKRTDVALLKIEATGLPVVKLGDPARLKVGEWVVAIGSPYGFDNSVTAGIVSAKGRSLPQENYVPFIQTDVAINPGNSGGPLFNTSGEVVGINSRFSSRNGDYIGLSFAIPIDVAIDIQNQLRASGKVSRGRLGVMIQEVTKELADSLGLAKPMGAVVNAVEKGSPAEKAGIEAGDVVLRFDGKPVNASADLPRIVAATKPGTKVMVQLWSKGNAREVGVVVGEVHDEKAATRASRGSRSADRAPNRLGLVVSELTPEQRRELKIGGGLLIEDLRGSTSRTDLRPGDIVLALIHKGATTEIKSVEQFNRLLSAFDKSANITLLVRRGEIQTFITIKGLSEN